MNARAESGAGTGQGLGWLDAIADPVRIQILRSLSRVGHATASDLAASTAASGPTVRRHLEALVTFGLVQEEPGESDGQTAGRPAARFSLPLELCRSIRSALP